MFSLLAGMGLLGGGAGAALGSRPRVEERHRPTRREEVGVTIGMLAFYAAVAIGLVVGWHQARALGLIVGGLFGLAGGFVVALLAVGIASLVERVVRTRS